MVPLTLIQSPNFKFSPFLARSIVVIFGRKRGMSPVHSLAKTKILIHESHDTEFVWTVWTMKNVKLFLPVAALIHKVLRPSH